MATMNSAPPENDSAPVIANAAAASARKPLSCVNCRQRKIKCDRVNPCVHCRKSNCPCIFPNRVRASRAKHKPGGERHSELLQRLSRLESLVCTIDAERIREQKDSQDPQSQYLQAQNEQMPLLGASALSTDEVSKTAPAKVPANALEQSYGHFVKKQRKTNGPLGGDFWTTVSDEVGEIRQLLEYDEDDEEEDEFGPDKEGSPRSRTAPLMPNILFGPLSSDSSPEYYPPPEENILLLDVYLKNVHPMVKVLHPPTAKLHLTSLNDLWDEIRGDYTFPSMKAILFASGLLACISMSSEECMTLLGKERHVLLAKYKRGTEIALGQAQVMSTVEILTLQALLLYIIALRTIDRSYTSWTFIAVAIRIAQGLGLHKNESTQNFTPYESEMRRRIWWQILVLDMRASDDRGTPPMILDGSFNTSMPSNIFEDEFGPLINDPIKPRIGFTDMTVCLMSYDTANVALQLSQPTLDPSRPPLTLLAKMALVKACGIRIEQQYLLGSDLNHPPIAMIQLTGRFLLRKLWALVQYPLQQRDLSAPHPKFPRGQALRTVTAVLEISLIIDSTPHVQNFVWFFRSWVPWHSLAVALVELCKETRGEIADKAWEVIERGYSDWSTRVSDVSWRPLRRLYHKAREAKQATMEEDEAQMKKQMLPEQRATTGDVVPGFPALSLSLDPIPQIQMFNFSNMQTGPEGQDMRLPWEVDALPEMEMDTLGADSFDSSWDNWNNFVYDINFDGGAMDI